MAFMEGFSLNRLNPRERLILLAGGGVVFVFILWGVLEFSGWYQSRMEMMDRLAHEKQQDRVALLQLQQEYSGLKEQFEKIEDRIARDQDSFSLLSFLESLAGKLGMRSNIAYMRPQPETNMEGFREMGVEVKVQNVTLEQAVRFLWKCRNEKAGISVFGHNGLVVDHQLFQGIRKLGFHLKRNDLDQPPFI